MTPCPTPEQLRQLLGEQLSGPNRDCVEAHVEACGACQQALEDLHDTFRAGKVAETPDPARSGDGSGGAFLRRLAAVSPDNLDVAVGGLLGDFRLVRQVGRGGMGVVYEAEQISLGRRVALKVLPFAATLDARHLQRFHNEAQAAAGLHHEHIVPVHAVGCDRGVHFYAMQLIEGQSLAALIQRLRRSAGREATEDAASTDISATPAGADPQATGPYHPPGDADDGVADAAPASAPRGEAHFRTAARLARQAAEALEHAHQQGVIHRDIKPANLLIDEHGELWVTDFGLAHCQRQAALTLTGDLLGTLRYMSPEQALARPGLIDQRTDVYSLGVTLYELLTLQPAFTGRDREELLRQIAFEEPPRPRRINRAVPAELEVIALKAMAREPSERYGTAQELADDLGRYLSDEPIRARPPGLLQRARKWTRRHRAATWALAVVAVVCLLAAGSLWYEHYQRRDKAAAKVVPALVEAETRLAEADWGTDNPARLLVVVERAEKAVEGAEGLLAMGGGTEELAGRVWDVRAAVDAAAVDARVSAHLDRIEVGLAGSLKKSTRRREEARVLAEYAAALRDYGVDLAAPEEAAARVRGSRVRPALLSALEEWRRSTTDATTRQRLEHVLDLADPAADAFRARWRAARRGKNGAALARLAQEPAVKGLLPTELLQLGHDLAAAKQLPAAAELLRDACRRHPESFWLSFSLGGILLDLNPPQAREAIACYRAALAARGPDPFIHVNLALALYLAGDVEESVRHCQAALDIDPNLVLAHNTLGLTLWAKGDRQGATRACQTALRIDPDYAPAHNNLGRYYYLTTGDLDAAVREYEAALRINPEAADAHNNFGLALQRKHDLEGAIRHYEAALRIDPEYADAHYNLGIALMARGDLDGAIRHYRWAAQLNPSDHDVHHNLGNALAAKGDREGAIREYWAAIEKNAKYPRPHYNLGVVLREKGDLEGAIGALRTAVRLDPGYAPAHYHLGLALVLKGDLEKAIPAYESCLAIDPGNALAHHNLGNTLHAKGDRQRAIREYRASLAINPMNPLGHCALGMLYLEQGRYAEALRSLQTGHRMGSLSKGWPHPSAQWVRQASTAVELVARLPKVLAGEAQPRDAADAVALARMCQDKKQYAGAARLYGAAFARDARLADDPDTGDRYNAACAAALAGCGQGKDAAALGAEERARLRRQALDWLRPDLAPYRELASGPAEVRAFVQKKMHHWQQDPDLAGVRGQALTELPEAERRDWARLWADVENTLHKAQRWSPSKEPS